MVRLRSAPDIALLLAAGVLAAAQVPPRQSPGQRAAVASMDAAWIRTPHTQPLEALLGSADFAMLPGPAAQEPRAGAADTQRTAGCVGSGPRLLGGRQQAPWQRPGRHSAAARSGRLVYTMWSLPQLFPGYIDMVGVWQLIVGSCSLSFGAASELALFGLPAFTAVPAIPRIPGAFPGGWPP